MNLEELQNVQLTERQKDSLQHLRPSFYAEVGEYIADLEAEREQVAEGADDPFSAPDVGRLTDEIETARDVVEAIYERRMGKLVKQASLAAAGLPADDEGLTAEEQDLFDELVSHIEANKGRVLETLAGNVDAASDGATDPRPEGRADPDRSAPESEPGPAVDRTADAPAERSTDASAERTPESSVERADAGESPPPTPPDEPDAEPTEAGDRAAGEGVSAADVMGGDPPMDVEADSTGETDRIDTDGGSAVARPADERGASEPIRDVDRVTVKMTTDVGAILGVDDREYTLEREDVVTLPEQNARPLVDRDAAEPLE